MKAFLFRNAVTGANTSAFYYSIVESRKALKGDRLLYLLHILMVSGIILFYYIERIIV
jgi:hypothetical protein